MVGGDKLSYELDASSPVAIIVEATLVSNSLISDAVRGSCFLICDLKNFFLATPMQRPGYMKIARIYFLQI